MFCISAKYDLKEAVAIMSVLMLTVQSSLALMSSKEGGRQDVGIANNDNQSEKSKNKSVDSTKRSTEISNAFH